MTGKYYRIWTATHRIRHHEDPLKAKDYSCVSCDGPINDGDYVRTVYRVRLERNKRTVLEVHREHACCPVFNRG